MQLMYSSVYSAAVCMHTFYNFNSAARVSHILHHQLAFDEKVGLISRKKNRNLIIKSTVLKVICPIKMSFSLKFHSI